MNPFASVGKLLVAAGLAVAALGAVLWLLGAGPFGHLPGDLAVRRGRLALYLPLASSLVLSAILTLLVNVWLHLRR